MGVKQALDLANEMLSKLSREWIIGLPFFCVSIIGIADYLIGTEISLSILYLIPTGIATWYIGKEAGMGIALLSALVGRASDLVTGIAIIHPWLTAWNVFLHLGFMLVVVYLLTHQKSYLRMEQQLARTDSLTGISNRRAFMESLQYILDVARREHWPVTLTYLDVDDFKQINDRKGHAEGDRVLCVVAAKLAESVRHSDVVARVGGDEFAVVLPHADRNAVEGFLHKLCRTEALSKELPVTCSAGCVTFRTLPLNAESAVKEVDLLMYKVKKQGKHQVAFAEVDSEKSSS